MSFRRLIFVNRVYWPDEAATAQLLHDLATALVREGVPVAVLASGAASEPTRETIDGVTIQRVRTMNRRRGGILARGWADALFLIRSFAAARREAQPGDVVVAMTDPPLLGLAVDAAARRQRAAVWHWCQDVYPEVAQAVAGSGIVRAGLGAFGPLRDRVWRRSEGCAVLGTDMAALVARRGVPKNRIHVIPNWAVTRACPAPDAETAFRHSAKVEGKFVVMYSGNLGRVHVFEPLLEAARRLRTREDIAFLFVGDGARYQQVAATAQAEALANVSFLPPQPRSGLSASLAAGDLQVVTLRPGCEGTVWPSKFYGAVAVARPLLYLGPATAEIAGLVSRHELGGAFGPDEGEAIARFIVQLADDAERQRRTRERVREFSATLPGLAGAVAHWKRVATRIEP